MSTPASPEQMRMVHAIARDAAEERHEHVRDRAARMFGVTSLTELDMDQMRQLIDVYKMMKPERAPPVMVMGRGALGGLPKRVTPVKPDVAPKPAKLHSTQMLATDPRTPVGSKPALIGSSGVADLVVQRPTFLKKKAVHNFDPDLKVVRGGVEEIPW
jgi:hypothetical protein